MDYYTLISERRSIRSYQKNKPVAREVIERIVNAGRIAPSAANKQPWKFIIVESGETLTKMRECNSKEWYKNAPHILVVVGDNAKAWQRGDGYNALETDLTIAMDHMILAAAYEKVGTCWVAAFDYDLIREALDLTESEEVFAITPLGYPEEGWEPLPGPKRKELSDVIEFR